MTSLAALVLDNDTPPQFLAPMLHALGAAHVDRPAILEAIVVMLAQTPLPIAARDAILHVLRIEYALANAHMVLADEPQPETGSNAWTPLTTTDQELRELYQQTQVEPHLWSTPKF